MDKHLDFTDKTSHLLDLIRADGLKVQHYYGMLAVGQEGEQVRNWQLYASSLSIHLHTPVVVAWTLPRPSNVSRFGIRQGVEYPVHAMLAVHEEMRPPANCQWRNTRGSDSVESLMLDLETATIDMLDSISSLTDQPIRIMPAMWHRPPALCVGKHHIVIDEPNNTINVFEQVGDKFAPTYRLEAVMQYPEKGAMAEWRRFAIEHKWRLNTKGKKT